MIQLTQLLQRLGVKSYNELNEEEKRTYREWELALSGRQITSPEVRAFLENDLEEAVTSLTSKALGERDDTFLKMKVEFIRKLLVFLDGPKREREAIEQVINQQLKS